MQILTGRISLCLRSQVDTVVFDKTGTLTAGKPQVTAVTPLADGFSRDDVLQLAAAVEQHASHPLARAVVRAAAAANGQRTADATAGVSSAGSSASASAIARPAGVPGDADAAASASGPDSRDSGSAVGPRCLDANSFSQQPGSGVSGTIGGRPVFVGNLEWVEAQVRVIAGLGV